MKTKLIKAFLFLVNVILPFPLLGLFIYLWYERTGGNVWFVTYIHLLAVIEGYVVPFIGINVLKAWYYNSPFLVGNIYIHHGFMIAPYNSIIFYVALNNYTNSRPINFLLTILVMAVLQSIVTSTHDFLAVSVKRIVICNTPARQGNKSFDIIRYFSFIGFAVIGGMFALSYLIAQQFFSEPGNRNIIVFILLLIAGFVISAVIPGLMYGIKERKNLFKPMTGR